MYWYHYTLIILGILIILYFYLSYHFYRKLLIRFNKRAKQLVDYNSDFYQGSYDWFAKIPKEDVFIRSYDNLKLHGIYIPSHDKNSSNLAIVIHGYQSQATDMIIIAKLYSDLGFKVLMIDLRGHGESEGKFTSMGHYEKYDLKKWLNFSLRNYGANSNILLHGVSMGAAMSMLVTELNIKNNLKYLVLDSGFTIFSKSLAYSIKNKLLKFFLPGISIFTYMFHRYTLKGIAPIKSIKRSNIPFLIIHGDQDRLVPLSMAQELYDSSPTSNKDLLIIENAPHAKAFEINKGLVTKTIIADISDIFNIKKSFIKNYDQN
ncbi:MAG: alpha/beta hydrolase [Candidatus Izemoplasmatales bacterium]|nr:alpha/beta hydrolase [Candidatus Izemoplasmatales bacterium]